MIRIVRFQTDSDELQCCLLRINRRVLDPLIPDLRQNLHHDLPEVEVEVVGAVVALVGLLLVDRPQIRRGHLRRQLRVLEHLRRLQEVQQALRAAEAVHRALVGRHQVGEPLAELEVVHERHWAVPLVLDQVGLLALIALERAQAARLEIGLEPPGVLLAEAVVFEVDVPVLVEMLDLGGVVEEVEAVFVVGEALAEDVDRVDFVGLRGEERRWGLRTCGGRPWRSS